MKDFIKSLLTKTLNKTDEELTDLLFEKSDDGSETLKDGSLDVVLDLIEKKVSKIKTDENKLRDSISKRVKAEVMTQFETELKEKYGVESDKTGVELVDEITESLKGGSELDPDKIKLSQVYRDREKELTKQIKDQKKEFDTALENFKIDQAKKEVWKSAEGYIRKKLAEINPALPKNPKASENLKNLFINSFTEFEYQLNGDDAPLPLKEGKRVEDKLGNEVPFDVLINERINEYFDIPVQSQKGGAGNEPGSPKVDGVPASFKDDSEYRSFIVKEADPQKRIAAKKIFEAQQKK